MTTVKVEYVRYERAALTLARYEPGASHILLREVLGDLFGFQNWEVTAKPLKAGDRVYNLKDAEIQILPGTILRSPVSGHAYVVQQWEDGKLRMLGTNDGVARYLSAYDQTNFDVVYSPYGG